MASKQLMGGVELPLSALRSQLASTVDVIVQTTRLRDGKRGVTHITEFSGVDPARLSLGGSFRGPPDPAR